VLDHHSSTGSQILDSAPGRFPSSLRIVPNRCATAGQSLFLPDRHIAMETTDRVGQGIDL
jgi:hypothetical protein